MGAWKDLALRVGSVRAQGAVWVVLPQEPGAPLTPRERYLVCALLGMATVSGVGVVAEVAADPLLRVGVFTRSVSVSVFV